MHHRTTATFNYYFNGEVHRIKLHELRLTCELSYSRPTDEGYEFESICFQINNGRLEINCVSGGRDCDGPIKYFAEGYAELHELKAGALNEGIRYPKWHWGDESVEDTYAIAAGY